MDSSQLVYAIAIVAFLWAIGEINVKAHFLDNVPAELCRKLQLAGWLFLRASVCVSTLFMINVHLDARAVVNQPDQMSPPGIVRSVDNRFTAVSKPVERPTLEWVEKGTGNRVTWTQKDNWIQWLQQQ